MGKGLLHPPTVRGADLGCRCEWFDAAAKTPCSRGAVEFVEMYDMVPFALCRPHARDVREAMADGLIEITRRKGRGGSG